LVEHAPRKGGVIGSSPISGLRPACPVGVQSRPSQAGSGRSLEPSQSRLESRVGPEEAAPRIITSEVLYQLSYVGRGIQFSRGQSGFVVIAQTATRYTISRIVASGVATRPRMLAPPPERRSCRTPRPARSTVTRSTTKPTSAAK
jgi:hypothetical protein